MPSNTKKPVSRSSSSGSSILKKSQSFSFKQLLVVLVPLAIIGGYFIFHSFASTGQPPSSLTIQYGQGTNPGSAAYKATDGFDGPEQCNYTTSDTPYGPGTPCIQYQSDPGGSVVEGRFGNVNFLSNKFTPSTGWMADIPNSGVPVGPILCQNLDEWFVGTGGTLSTAFGPLANGELFRYYTTSTGGVNNHSYWQDEWGFYNPLNKDCSTSGGWMTVTAGIPG